MATGGTMVAVVARGDGGLIRLAVLLQPADVASVLIHALELPRNAEVTDVHIRPFRKPG